MQINLGESRSPFKLKRLLLNLAETEAEEELVELVGSGIKSKNVTADDIEGAHTAAEFRAILLQKQCVGENQFTLAQADWVWQKLCQDPTVTVTTYEPENEVSLSPLLQYLR